MWGNLGAGPRHLVYRRAWCCSLINIQGMQNLWMNTQEFPPSEIPKEATRPLRRGSTEGLSLPDFAAFYTNYQIGLTRYRPGDFHLPSIRRSAIILQPVQHHAFV